LSTLASQKCLTSFDTTYPDPSAAAPFNSTDVPSRPVSDQALRYNLCKIARKKIRKSQRRHDEQRPLASG
jgi:hypothetical protein